MSDTFQPQSTLNLRATASFWSQWEDSIDQPESWRRLVNLANWDGNGMFPVDFVCRVTDEESKMKNGKMQSEVLDKPNKAQNKVQNEFY